MSQPIKINTENEFNSFVLSKYMEKIFEAQRHSINFKSGGIICGTAHQGEAIIQKRNHFCKLDIKELP